MSCSTYNPSESFFSQKSTEPYKTRFSYDFAMTSYERWIRANNAEEIDFEMISYNTLITRPTKEEIVLYNKDRC